MKRRNLLFSTVVATMTLTTALPLSAGQAEDTAAIRDLWKTYQTVRMAGDADAYLALWDENGIQMPPGVPARGMDALKVGVPKGFAAVPVSQMEITPIDIEIAGDWAFARGEYTATQVVGGNDVEVDGKFMTILKRQDDGSWKIYRDIFNSNK